MEEDPGGKAKPDEIQPAVGHRADKALAAAPLPEIPHVFRRHREDAKQEEHPLITHGRGHKRAASKPEDDDGHGQETAEGRCKRPHKTYDGGLQVV